MAEEWDVEEGGEQKAPAAQAKAGEGQTAKTASHFRNTSTPQPGDTHTTDNALSELPPVVTQPGKPVDFGKGFPAEFDENFPTDIKDLPKCYEILRQVRALPETAKNGSSDKRKVAEKRRREALISAHITKLSNPSAIVEIDADGQAKAQKNHAAIIKRERIESLARQDHLIAEFIKDFDKQAKTIVSQATKIAALESEDTSKIIVALQAKVNDLQAAIAALKTENETLKKK
ncbi:MAG: hypothetical protein WCH99_08835 [Verrucomicrobiota bacterium]